MTYTPDKPIRALSWKEPFASLMLHGKIETRTWATSYRGWVLICASKAPYNARQIDSLANKRHQIRITGVLLDAGRDINPGMAIAVGFLGNCRHMLPTDAEKCFVDYHPDLYVHIYMDVQPIVPFPWKGSQGWRTLGPEDKAKIKLL